MFNVLWLTSVTGWTGRVAARCTCLPNYCSLRGVQQIYGQWEESSIPTITPGTGIKLTICNLNRFNTPASREKHNQPGRGLEEINSQALFCLFLLSPFVSFLLSYLSTHFLLSLTGWMLYSLTVLHSLHFDSFLHLQLCFSSVALSPLSSTHWHLSWQRFPLSKEWEYLPGNWLQPSTMADWRLVSLLDLTLRHSLFSPLWAQIRLLTSLSRCSHRGPCPVNGIYGPMATSFLICRATALWLTGALSQMHVSMCHTQNDPCSLHRYLYRLI